MSEESVNQPTCDHTFKKLEETPERWILCCSKCGKLVNQPPPKEIVEGSESKRLLME
jgi:hypothetical protein